MNKLFWIAAGASLGIGAYIIFNGQTAPSYTSGYDADDAADDLTSGARRFSRKASNWGTGQRVSGTAGQVGGRLKEGLGNITNDPDRPPPALPIRSSAPSRTQPDAPLTPSATRSPTSPAKAPHSAKQKGLAITASLRLDVQEFRP